MNVIVTNKQKQIIDNANIDAIKDFNGLFGVDDLISKLKNYFFNKVILDATSVVNFASKDVIMKLASSIGPDRLVILLPAEPAPPVEFVNMLKSLQIFNFSNRIDDIVKYLANPNTIDNSTTNNDNYYVDNSIKATDTYEVEETTENVPVENSNLVNNNQVVETSPSQENNYQEPNNEDDQYNENDSIYNVDGDNDEPVENTNIDNSFYVSDEIKSVSANKIIIGLKNVTSHAGSSTLIYLLRKKLQSKKKNPVLAIEVNKDDFKYFREDNMISVSGDELLNAISNSNFEIIFVDMNDYQGSYDVFTDVIYLVEPSIIKLNTLMMTDRFIFRDLKNKHVILNKSLLSNSDVLALSKEAGVEMMMNIPPINDRIDNEYIVKLLEFLKLI